MDYNAYIKELKYCTRYECILLLLSFSSLTLVLKRQLKPGGFCSRRSRGEQRLARVTPRGKATWFSCDSSPALPWLPRG